MKIKNFEYYVNVNNKKYSYTLEKVGKNSTLIECVAANIGQEFLDEDVPNLLRDLPNLILAEQEYSAKQGQVIRFRVTPGDKKIIMKKAYAKGYKNVSGFLRDLLLNSDLG